MRTATPPGGAHPAAARSAESLRRRIAPFLVSHMIWWILIAVTLGFSLVVPKLLSVDSLINLLVLSSVVGILVIGAAFVLLTGHFDLSIESTLGFTALIGAWLVAEGSTGSGLHVHPFVAVIIMLLIGAGVGAVNAFFVVKLKINAFVVTLSTLIILRGLTQVWTGATTVYDMPDAFTVLGKSDLGGLPASVLVMIVAFIVAQIVLSFRPFGRGLYAVGGNRRAAFASGIRVERTIAASFIISGVLAAFAGWVLAGRLGAVTVTLGTGLAFEVFAAAVIGGISLSGGRGTMIGALGGVLLIGVIRTALNLMDISPFWVDAIRGMVILLAVTLDALVMRFEENWRRSAPVTLRVEAVPGGGGS